MSNSTFVFFTKKNLTKDYTNYPSVSFIEKCSSVLFFSIMNSVYLENGYSEIPKFTIFTLNRQYHDTTVISKQYCILIKKILGRVSGYVFFYRRKTVLLRKLKIITL